MTVVDLMCSIVIESNPHYYNTDDKLGFYRSKFVSISNTANTSRMHKNPIDKMKRKEAREQKEREEEKERRIVKFSARN